MCELELFLVFENLIGMAKAEKGTKIDENVQNEQTKIGWKMIGAEQRCPGNLAVVEGGNTEKRMPASKSVCSIRVLRHGTPAFSEKAEGTGSTVPWKQRNAVLHLQKYVQVRSKDRHETHTRKMWNLGGPDRQP